MNFKTARGGNGAESYLEIRQDGDRLRTVRFAKRRGTSQTALSEEWWEWAPDCYGLRNEWEVKTGPAACKLTLSRNMVVRGRGGRRPETGRWRQEGFSRGLEVGRDSSSCKPE